MQHGYEMSKIVLPEKIFSPLNRRKVFCIEKTSSEIDIAIEQLKYNSWL